MGGKSSQSTQTVSIPPEILARYNAVNARAETTAQTPFQQYSTNPADFVAPLTPTQQAGIANTNYYSGTAQPYYEAATGQLGAAQQAALPFYGQSAQNVGQAQGVGNMMAGASLGALGQGAAAASPLQQQAQYGLMGAYGAAQPFNQAAANYMGAGAQAVNPGALGAEQINQYMSPYISNVLQGTAAMQNQMNQQAMSGQTGNAIRSGAFGGDRAGIAAANLAQQQQIANAKIFSDILNQGYGQALGTAQQQQQLGLGAEQANRAALQQAAQQALGIGQQQFGQGLSAAQQQAALGQQLYGQGANTAQQLAALGQQQFGQGMTAAQQQQALAQGLYGMGANTSQQMAALGQGAQGAGLQGAQAQLAAGQAQQQTEQAGLQALYNQYLQQMSYPFQTAQFLANIAMGTGALSGSTTQTNQMGGGFSDRRLKENIRPVGKTFDGQTIYSYNFKGEPKTEIGLIAQEVEKKHPEAVGLAGGYKTVHYGKATDDAADRGHFAYGGSAMGGGVMPQHAGEGFYDGGYVGGFDPGLMQQILSSYQQMYAPIAGQPGQNGGLGAASFVPAGNLPVGSLQTAGELPAMRNPMESAANAVSIGKNIGEIGGKVGAWKWGDEEKEKTPDREDTPEELKGIYQRGGRAGLAGGGVPTEISIPNEKEKVEPLKPAEAPKPQEDKTAETIQALAKIAMMAGARNGGRIGYGVGGTPYGNGGGYVSDVLQEQNKQKTPELLKPGGGLNQGPDTLGNVAKGVGIVSGLMNIGSKLGISDRRAKENIRPVGKTFDGQTVYSFNYKGDHQTQMGLIAQEVEKHHPGAVSTVKGLKAVDYKKATGHAAKRGHFAEGGLAGFDRMGEAQEPDFNLDPEDLIAGEDQEFEALLRGPEKRLENPEKKGLAPMTFGDEALKSWEEEKAKRAERLKLYGGLGAGDRGEEGALTGDLGAITRMIRGHEGFRKNPRSSATGPYQMIDSTFINYFRKMFPDQAKGKSDREILTIRSTPAGISVSEKMGPQIIRDNARIIAEGGFSPNAQNVYLAHFFGPQTALKVLRADPNTPIKQIVGKAAVESNPFLANKSAAGAIQFAQNAMSKQQRLLSGPGKAEGGLIGRHGYQTDGAVLPEEEKKPAEGLAAAEAPVQDAPQSPAAAEEPKEILVNAKREKPKEILPELPQRGISFGQGTSQKPAYFGGSNIPGYSVDYMTDPFFKGLKKGTASSWIPFLTGLGTFATTPTRSMLSGLLAGVGAGAQTYASLANERNKQLPARQAAAARQADVARILANNLLRQDPNDPSRFIYMYPGAKTGISIDAGQRQSILQQMLTGNMNYMPPPPEGAREWSPMVTAAPEYKPSRVAPSNNSVEGIVESAMQVPEIKTAYNAYLQAKVNADRAQAQVDSPFGSDEDRASAVTRLNAATQLAATNKATFESLMGRIADPKLAALGTSTSQIGASNIATYERRVATSDAYQDLKPVLAAIKDNGYGAGALSGILNWAASAADTLGLPKELFGDTRSASQRQEALSALLAGSGVSADAASIERDPVALKAVVDALEAKIRRAENATNAARSQITTTATPRLLDTTVPTGAPGQPSGRPGAQPQSGGPRRMPIGNDRFGYASENDALNDPRLPRGSRYRVWDARSNRFGPERIKP